MVVRMSTFTFVPENPPHPPGKSGNDTVFERPESGPGHGEEAFGTVPGFPASHVPPVLSSIGVLLPRSRGRVT